MRRQHSGRKYADRQELRRLLVDAAERLVKERGDAPLYTVDGDWVAGGTSHELAALTGLALGLAREEIENMRRRGELVRLGRVRSALGNRPLVVYGPGTSASTEAALPGLAMLDTMMRGWTRAE